MNGLSEDQEAIRELAARFTAEQITPQAAEWDETASTSRAMS